MRDRQREVEREVDRNRWGRSHRGSRSTWGPRPDISASHPQPTWAAGGRGPGVRIGRRASSPPCLPLSPLLSPLSRPMCVCVCVCVCVCILSILYYVILYVCNYISSDPRLSCFPPSAVIYIILYYMYITIGRRWSDKVQDYSALLKERKICLSPAPPSTTWPLPWVGFTHTYLHMWTHVFNIKYSNDNKRHMLAPSQQAVIKRNSFGGGHFVCELCVWVMFSYIHRYTRTILKSERASESESARERERGKRERVKTSSFKATQ